MKKFIPIAISGIILLSTFVACTKTDVTTTTTTKAQTTAITTTTPTVTNVSTATTAD